MNPHQLFWQGVLSAVLNPKIAIFFLSFLPQFVDLRSSQVTLHMVTVGLTFACMGLCFLLVVGYFSGAIVGWQISLGIRLAPTERQ